MPRAGRRGSNAGMNRRLALALVALGSLLAPLAFARRPAAPAGPHTVILVRHAEKDTAQDKNDPPLTELGTKRAEELARLLGHAGVTRLVASEFRRTQATLAPLAAATGLSVETRPAKELEALAVELAAAPAGSVTVVAGHSNTIPALAERLLGTPLPGLAAGANLADDEYDRLFVLTLGLGSAESSPRGLALELRQAPR